MNTFPIAYVNIWDFLVGSVIWNNDKDYATFEFDKKFLSKNLDLAPIKMPLKEMLRSGNRIFEFPELSRNTYKGLPGLLADSLPDRFGNRVIDSWLARKGRTPESFNPIERLCYTGKRGMGALEFKPVPGEIKKLIEKSTPIEIQELVKLAQQVIDERTELEVNLKEDTSNALLDILRVGTSAGGNRPKAVIAYNDKTGKVRSGQIETPDGFEYWILKFDGVKDNTLNDSSSYGRIEFAYYQMAKKCQIKMTECRLLEENGRTHFMTKRFDRDKNYGKFHLQSLCGIAHFDFNLPGEYSYEQAFQIMRELRLSYIQKEQLYRRMVFNIVARNQDDHTKNISFIMDKNGKWFLAPAYDLIFSYNPTGFFTNKQQMTVNGKRENYTKKDLYKIGNEMDIKSYKIIVEEIIEVVANWKNFAEETEIEIKILEKVYDNLRINI